MKDGNGIRKVLVDTFCDGAAMAYHDCAVVIRETIAKAPPEISHIVSGLEPFAAAFENKGNTVHEQTELFALFISGKPQ